MSTITLYTTPCCTDCSAAKSSMNSAGIEFAQINLSAFPSSLEYVLSLGHQRAPVTVIQDEDGIEVDHWSGFRPDKILALKRTRAARR